MYPRIGHARKYSTDPSQHMQITFSRNAETVYSPAMRCITCAQVRILPSTNCRPRVVTHPRCRCARAVKGTHSNCHSFFCERGLLLSAAWLQRRTLPARPSPSVWVRADATASRLQHAVCGARLRDVSRRVQPTPETSWMRHEDVTGEPTKHASSNACNLAQPGAHGEARTARGSPRARPPQRGALRRRCSRRRCVLNREGAWRPQADTPAGGDGAGRFGGGGGARAAAFAKGRLNEYARRRLDSFRQRVGVDGDALDADVCDWRVARVARRLRPRSRRVSPACAVQACTSCTARAFSIASSTSCPPITRPNTVFLPVQEGPCEWHAARRAHTPHARQAHAPFRCGCFAYVMKNWLAFVFGPLFAIDTMPRAECCSRNAGGVSCVSQSDPPGKAQGRHARALGGDTCLQRLPQLILKASAPDARAAFAGVCRHATQLQSARTPCFLPRQRAPRLLGRHPGP
jgi:hypothetical protein